MRTLDVAWERAKILRDWRIWGRRIAQTARIALGQDLVGVYVFGSVVKDEAVACSDVDLLIVAKKLPMSHIERSEIKLKIMDSAGLPSVNPFEIHLVDEEEAVVYFRHIGEALMRIE